MIQEHQGIITNLCVLYYPYFEDQRDARQDIILQLWKSFPSFRGESKLSTWIYKVSLNTILSKIKKESKAALTETLGPQHNSLVISHNSYDDDLQLLNHLLQSLKPLDKAVIILYLEGYKNKEMAKLLSLTPSNISTRLNRIRTQLKSNFTIYTHELKRS
ncbi:MAG: sigma-70 family RNA polymerase sigma factor [Cyclobacteriaceae bacterium]|nr:sigma-70 family RNA polymerase sigma factor [Cyclobacteriaceae bacterium]